MRYAVLDGNTVTNIVKADNPAFAAAQGWVACPPEVSRWWTYDGSTFSPGVAPVVPLGPNVSVTNLQFRKAIRASGKAAQFKTHYQSLTEEAQEEWQFAPAIRRGSDMVAAAAAALGVTDAQVDSLFRAARKL